MRYREINCNRRFEMELNRRNSVRAVIQRTLEFVRSPGLANLNLLAAQERLRLAEEAFGRFNDEHLAVLENIVVEEDMQVFHDYSAQVEEMHLEIVIALKGRLQELQPIPVAAPIQNQPMNRVVRANDQNGNVPDICLERINPPIFRGDFAKWSEWKAMFESLVHNHQNLTDTQKFHYLKKAVADGAANVLDGWHTIGDNYRPAYEALIQLYENRYRIVLAHIDELHHMPKLEKETYDGLRQMIDTTNRALRQLRVIGSPVQHWDHMVIYELLIRMPKTTITHWETSQDLNDMPTLEQVLRFLERRARGIVNIGARVSNGNQSGVQFENSNENTVEKNKSQKPVQPNNGPKSGQGQSQRQSLACFKCKQPHPLARCNEFTNMTLEARKLYIRETKLCANCFSPTHRAGSPQCKFGPCRRCRQANHNTLLCELPPPTVAAVVTGQFDVPTLLRNNNENADFC